MIETASRALFSSRAEYLSFVRFLSFPRVRILMLSYDVQASHLNVTFSSLMFERRKDLPT